MSETIRLEIHRPDKPPVVQAVEPGIYPIGSDRDNAIVLPGADVAGRHAVLCVNPDGHWVEDLSSESGTFVNGERVNGRCALEPGHHLTIARYLIVLSGDAAAAAQNQPPAPPKRQKPAAPAPSPAPVALDAGAGNLSAAAQKRLIKKQIQEELVKRLNLRRLTAAKIDAEDLQKRALETVRAIVAEVAGRLPAGMDPEALIKEIYDEAVALGPLEILLDDQEITEIMVNGPDNVFVEKGGKLVRTDLTFVDDASVIAIIERIVSPLGRRIDESQPYVDARLKDGSRVNAIIHPLSLVGPCLTIRKFSKVPFTDQDMVRFGTMTQLMADFSRACVLARKNIVISGGTGSGKTTLLNVFGDYLPRDERIVTIEDAAELRLSQSHVISLEARPANIEGKGAITIRDLVRNALRMRPDRIVVGECRGGEALDMLQAMNTGHDGSLTTVHANSPRDVISRLETMVLMSGMDLPVRAIREQIAAAIDLVVHTARMSDGSRKVTAVSEVVGLEGDKITMQDIFLFAQSGVGDNGKVLGAFVPTGAVPTFTEEFKRRGIELDPSTFDPQRWKR